MSLDFMAGCVGGAAGVIVGHPLDTVKVRLQIQSSENAKYRGTFHCLSTIVKNESFRGLYKGISSPLVGVAGVNALIFGVYGSLRPYVHGQPGNDRLWAHFVAGSISGGVQSFIASPMELIKTRMQLNEGTVGGVATKQPGFMEVAKSVYQKEGGFRRGIYKGFGVTVAREIPGFGFYFATYEALTTKSGREVGTFGMMMAGGMAGVVSWVVTFPTDVVKTRLQSDVSGKYTGAFDCIRKTYQSEGMKAFFRGLGSTVIRAFPTNAATFTVVTWIMRWYESNHLDSIQDGKDYLKDVLKETARIRETFERALRLPLPHYFTHSLFPKGTHTLGFSCASFVTKPTATPYFNLHSPFTTAALCKGGGGAESSSGILRERFTEAFRNDREEAEAMAAERRDTLVSNLTPNQEPVDAALENDQALPTTTPTTTTTSDEKSPVVSGSSGLMRLLHMLFGPSLSCLEENRFLSFIS